MRGKSPTVGLMLATVLLAVVSPACTLGYFTDPPPAEELEIPTELVCDGPGDPGPAPLRLLTRTEYNNTIRDLLGDATRPADEFPAENQFLGFDNNSSVHVATQPHVNKYQSVAVEVAERAVADNLAQLLPCDPELVGNVRCAGEFMDQFLRRAFRRTPDASERQIFDDLFNMVYAESGFAVGVEVVIQAVIQSPQFLYRVESFSEYDPTTEMMHLSSAAIASRLSYFFWSSAPDDELLDLVGRDALRTPEAVEAQARRLLADPRAREGIENFYAQWLETRNFMSLLKDSAVYPGFSPAAALDLRDSLHLFMEEVFVDSDNGMEALFESDGVYVNARLAQLYGYSNSSTSFMRASADPSQRKGLLSQPAMMALLAKPDQSSPIHRGVFVREKIMCEVIQPPPPELVVTAPDPDPSATTRERFRVHTAHAACAGCHRLIDPIGFTFESYDGIGAYRSEEYGMPVETSGAMVDPREASLAGPLDDSLQLSARLTQSDSVRNCVATNWFRFAMGRLETKEDLCTIKHLADDLGAAGGDFKEMMVALAVSDAFRQRLPDAEDLARAGQ